MKKLKQLWLVGICWISVSVGYAHLPPALLLVHGALFTSQVWLPVQAYLQNQGYATLTLDTPGRLNDGVKPEQTTLSTAVDKLCDLINLQPNQLGQLLETISDLQGSI